MQIAVPELYSITCSFPFEIPSNGDLSEIMIIMFRDHAVIAFRQKYSSVCVPWYTRTHTHTLHVWLHPPHTHTHMHTPGLHPPPTHTHYDCTPPPHTHAHTHTHTHTHTCTHIHSISCQLSCSGARAVMSVRVATGWRRTSAWACAYSTIFL